MTTRQSLSKATIEVALEEYDPSTKVRGFLTTHPAMIGRIIIVEDGFIGPKAHVSIHRPALAEERLETNLTGPIAEVLSDDTIVRSLVQTGVWRLTAADGPANGLPESAELANRCAAAVAAYNQLIA